MRDGVRAEGSLPLRSQDALLAAAVTAVSIAEIWVPFSSAMGDGSRPESTGMVVAFGACLAFRRSQPLLVLGSILGVGLLALLLAPVFVLFWGGMVPVMLATYTVARHEPAQRAWVAVGASGGALLALDLLVAGLREPNEFAFRWVNAVLAFGLGRALKRTEDRARQSALRARLAEEGLERATEDALAEERTRIAREMHDVVAHSVSVMVVQAGAAEAALDEDPDYARAALGRIRSTGAEAMEDMRRVLTVLRSDARPLAPQPGLADVPELVAETAEAGIQADLRVEGSPRPVPAGLDLAAYRIVQEALTNIRRHADAGRVRVYVRYDDRGVEVEVVDDGGRRGGASAREPRPAGHGLLGMRERVALYGGQLRTGPDEDGYRVLATLPLTAS